MTNRKFFILLAFSGSMVLLSTFFSYYSYILPEISCRKQGGLWTRCDASDRGRCGLQMLDAGKECTTSEDCDGYCTLSDSQMDLLRNNQPLEQGDPVRGVCSKYSIATDVPMEGGRYGQTTVHNGGSLTYGCIQ